MTTETCPRCGAQMPACGACGFAEADYLTVDEAARLLGVTDQTIRNARTNGLIPGSIEEPLVTGPFRYRLPRSEVEALQGRIGAGAIRDGTSAYARKGREPDESVA